MIVGALGAGPTFRAEPVDNQALSTRGKPDLQAGIIHKHKPLSTIFLANRAPGRIHAYCPGPLGFSPAY
jgi:hypothetical protein